MGFIIYYRDADDNLCKRFCYVTGQSSLIPNWDFTRTAWLEVLRYVIPLIGSVKYITGGCDGCACQVQTLIFLKSSLLNIQELDGICFLGSAGDY